MDAFDRARERKRIINLAATGFSRGKTQNRPQPLAAGKQTVAHRFVDGWRRCIFFWQKTVQRAIDHLLTGFEILGQIHVTECCDSMAGYYILDARCVMLNAKVHRAVADCDSGQRGLLACCRRQFADDNPLCRNRKINQSLK